MPSVRFHIKVDEPICSGDEFVASVLIDAPDAAVNAAQGTFLYDPAQLTPVAVRYGNSILRYWVQPPSLPETSGEIPFIGGLPYPGFIGNGGPIMSVVFRAEGSNTDTALSFASDAQAILNDGQGTAADTQAEAMTIALVERKAAICSTAPERKDVFEDSTQPEPFDVIIAQSEKAFSGEYFAAFDAVDKGTGIDHYEVRESSLYQSTPWFNTSSPYHLQTQGGQVLVEVRAVDGAGNMRYASASQELTPTAKPFGVESVLLIAAAFSIGAFIFFLCKKKKKEK